MIKSRLFVTILIVVMGLGVASFGDIVRTWDGLMFEGTLVAGLPDRITVEMSGAKYMVDVDSMTELTFSERSDMISIVTSTGERIQGEMISSVGRMTIRTESGDTEIPNDKVERISFPYVQKDPPSYSTSIILTDDVTFEGNLASTFPRQISIDQNGIIGNVVREKIVSLTFDTPSRIETAERTYEGTLISDLPDEIELATSYGSISVRRTSVRQIQLSHVPPGWGYTSSSSSSGMGAGTWVLLILGGLALITVVILLL